MAQSLIFFTKFSSCSRYISWQLTKIIQSLRFVGILRLSLLVEDVVKDLDDVDPEHIEAVELLALVQEEDDQEWFVHFRHLHLVIQGENSL